MDICSRLVRAVADGMTRRSAAKRFGVAASTAKPRRYQPWRYQPWRYQPWRYQPWRYQPRRYQGAI